MDQFKSGSGSSGSDLPPGFRFHPTDEELIMYYLRNRVTARPCPISIITEVDIYKFDPWQLPEKAKFGEREWYFFSQRDRKYPNGARPNRAATSGYWKATGTDKSICSGSTNVGVKKALVFYKGRPPKGVKTDWIMHEYRLCDSKRRDKMLNGSMKLDDWVLCRIYKKRHLKRIIEQKQECSYSQGSVTTVIESDRASNLPRPTSFLNLLEFDHQAVSWLLTGNPIDSGFQIYDNNHDLVCGDMDDFQRSSVPCQLLNASLH